MCMFIFALIEGSAFSVCGTYQAYLTVLHAQAEQAESREHILK